jgi:N-acetylneuraminate synthase
MRETPWGYMTYLEYRERVEFVRMIYKEIDQLCKEIGIDWFASVWDEEAIDFLEHFNRLPIKFPLQV